MPINSYRKKKRMLDYWLDRKHYVAQFSDLRCFDTVSRRPYCCFSIALKVILSLSDRTTITLRCPVFRFNPGIYFRQRACCVSVVSVNVQFLLSDQAISKRHETGNIPLPRVPTLSSFPIFVLQQTNKTLVSLLSFKVDLMPKNMILTQFSPLSYWDW